MAEVWYVYEGPKSIHVSPELNSRKYKRSIADCEQLGLLQSHFINSLEDGMPSFSDPSGLGTIPGYKRVVIEIEEDEAKSSGWKSGYYELPKRHKDVTTIWGKPDY